MPILTPEQEVREQINQMLEAAGWQVQTRRQMNLTAATRVTAVFLVSRPSCLGMAIAIVLATWAPIVRQGLIRRLGYTG